MTAQLAGSLYRDGAFFDHQPVALSPLGDGFGHSLNGGQIGIAIFERRSAHADKNTLSPVNRFLGRAKFQAASSAALLHHRLEKRLEEWQDAFLQLSQLLRVAFAAKY